jgi:hypothetical protein|tara:strand:- start:1160 stop:1543 length:384 start_codon:yes stop_codon:yes gene_type:complete
MAKLEVFQNGNFSSGDPAYQIGTKYKDGEYGEYGEYDIVVFDPMTKRQAEKRLAEMQPAAKEKAASVPKKTVTKKKAAKLKIPSKVELELLTKAELEKEMRKHGLELDRRETKGALIKQSVAFLKGK